MGFESNYPIKIPSKQLNISLFSTLSNHKIDKQGISSLPTEPSRWGYADMSITSDTPPLRTLQYARRDCIDEGGLLNP